MRSRLWIKAVSDAWLLLAALALGLFLFQWLFVYIVSQIPLGNMAALVRLLPPIVGDLAGMPLDTVATPAGRLAVAYVDAVVVLSMTAWSISRGSDAVSGELGRGTMEMVLAQPVSRVEVLAVQATVTTVGSALLALAAWLGTGVGLWTIPLEEPVALALFVPSALNLFGFMFFLAAFSTLVSSFHSVRWHTVGLVGGLYAVQLVIKIVARMVHKLSWLLWCTFLGAFEPQIMVIRPLAAWTMLLKYDGVLIGLGLACYVAAAVIFARRDLPAPL